MEVELLRPPKLTPPAEGGSRSMPDTELPRAEMRTRKLSPARTVSGASMETSAAARSRQASRATRTASPLRPRP